MKYVLILMMLLSANGCEKVEAQNYRYEESNAANNQQVYHRRNDNVERFENEEVVCYTFFKTDTSFTYKGFSAGGGIWCHWKK